MNSLHADPVKFALVSHVLPPSPSGQAIVLSRLLRDTDPAHYCLISERDYSNNRENTTPPLRGAYFSVGAGRAYRLTEVARNFRAELSRFGQYIRTHSSRFFNGQADTPTPNNLPTTDNPALQGWTARIKATVVGIEDRMHLSRDLCRQATRIAQIVVKERCNAIVACSGNLIDLPASCLAARWLRVPFYAYMFDDYATTSTSFVQHRFSQKMMRQLMRESTGVIVPNEFLALAYHTQYYVNPSIIPNPVELNAPIFYRARSILGPRRLLYTGAVYEAHFDALHRLLLTLTAMAPTAPELHIYTSSNKEYLARHLIAQPAIIHSPVSADKSMRLQQEADILFLPLAFDSPIPETIKTSAPGKMGELLASGRPVLVHAPKDSFVSWYFRKNNCGEVVDERDQTKLRQAIERLLHDPDHCRKLVSRAIDRARRDFDLSAARSRFFEMLNGPRRQLVA